LKRIDAPSNEIKTIPVIVRVIKLFNFRILLSDLVLLPYLHL
jgi:hypothetical protein